jgi:WLM domain
LIGQPTAAAQASVLAAVRAELEPMLVREGLPTEFVLRPGLRLRRAYGHCAWRAGVPVPIITVRCTADGDRTRWRRLGAIVGTLLHELAHLRYRSHGPRFWALHRRLVDRAFVLGAYDPHDRDPGERGRGDEKLAGSAAWPIAAAARDKRIAARKRIDPSAFQATSPATQLRFL